MEVCYHLIYVGKDLGESNGFDETDEAESKQLSLRKGSRGRAREERRRLVSEQSHTGEKLSGHRG